MLRLTLSSIASLLAIASVTKAWEQIPLSSERYDAGLFQPLGNLDLLSTDAFTTLGHPAYPNYNVRVKKADVCNDGAGAYTGYIDVQARHIFFYFFESQSDPESDDVIFWTSGGPGCTAALGAFFDFGPCKIVGRNKTVDNPYSWTRKASIFAVDQPIGVGFSYAEFGETVSRTEESAKDIAAFVTIFFEHFTKFKGNPFHMASSSYGGRYIPVFASEIWDNNAKLIEAGMSPINISSIMIGNGCTDHVTMLPSYYDMQCTGATFTPKMDITSCVRQKIALPRCEKWLRESCRDVYDHMNCQAAMNFCGAEIEAPFWADKTNNPYDMREDCKGDLEVDLCYPATKSVEDWLNRPDIRELLGVDPAISGNYYLTALLERGVRTLLYVGTADWICNWIGNDRMANALEWTQAEEYAAATWEPWAVEGELAGYVKGAGPLTYIQLLDAGHMAPYDAPKESLEMLSQWLAGEFEVAEECYDL